MGYSSCRSPSCYVSHVGAIITGENMENVTKLKVCGKKEPRSSDYIVKESNGFIIMMMF